MNKAQKKARLKHLNNIHTGVFFRQKKRDQQTAKIIQLLLPNQRETLSDLIKLAHTLRAATGGHTHAIL